MFVVSKPGHSSKRYGVKGKQTLVTYRATDSDFQDGSSKLDFFPNYLKSSTDLHSSISEETLEHPSDSRILGCSECFCIDVISAS